VSYIVRVVHAAVTCLHSNCSELSLNAIPKHHTVAHAQAAWLCEHYSGHLRLCCSSVAYKLLLTNAAALVLRCVIYAQAKAAAQEALAQFEKGSAQRSSRSLNGSGSSRRKQSSVGGDSLVQPIEDVDDAQLLEQSSNR
jgi:hypothetical protein